MTSGGSWRSASSTITASPTARSRPAVRATWCPKLRESRMRRNRSSFWAASSISSYVRSRLPSSTRIASASPSSASITSMSRLDSSPMTASSSWAGITSEYVRAGPVEPSRDPSGTATEQVYLGRSAGPRAVSGRLGAAGSLDARSGEVPSNRPWGGQADAPPSVPHDPPGASGTR